MEKISVLMSTYNETLRDIERAICSIQVQSYQNLEFMIICDNPNNHELKLYLSQIEKEDSRIKIFVNDHNIGLAESLNKALALSTGDYIARMDADDYSMPNRLEKQLQFLKQKHLDLVGCYVECVDEFYNTIYYMKSMPIDTQSVKKSVLINNPVAHPTWLGKRELFISNQGYRNVPYAEDYDFILRALEKNYLIGNLAEVLFKYTIRDSSISKSNGLKQYVVSKELVKKFKDLSLSKTDVSDIKNCLTQINSNQELKYAKAANDFAIAVKKVNQKNIVFIYYLIKASFKSRYFLRKIIGYIRVFL